MPPKLLADLPADVVQHILGRLTLAHHIARIAPTCKVVSVAARNAMKVRKFSGEVVTLVGHNVMSVASAAESAWELRSQISDLEQQRDEALQMNAALARRVVLERVEADRAAAAATAVAWASQDPEGYVI